MVVDVHPSIWIERPREEVAAYMFNPLHDQSWMRAVVESRPDQPGPLELGHTFTHTVKFMGRTWESMYVVTSYKPERLLEIKTDWPFPTTVRFELTRGTDGTAVAIRAVGRPGLTFGILTPFLNRRAHRSFAADLEQLKAILEG
jgi:hypothetical protein